MSSGTKKTDEDRVVLGHLSATVLRDRGRDAAGRRYWRIRTRDAARTTVTSGWWTREEAVQAIAEAVQLPRSVPSTSAAIERVSQLVTAWSEAQARRADAGEHAEATRDTYTMAARRWLATSVAELSVDRLCKAAVADQVTAWRADGASKRTVDFQIRILRQVIRWGADRKLCPAIDLAIPTSARDDEHVYCGRVPSRLELDQALDRVSVGPKRDAIEILGLTGARVGEIAALRVRDVDLAARTIRLSGKDEERGRRGKVVSRLFPLRGRLEALVRQLVAGKADPEARLLELPGEREQAVYDALARAAEVAGVEHLSPHAIRRLVVGELLEVADAKRVSQLTGHSVMVLLRYYVRPTADELAELVEAAALGTPRKRRVVPMKRRTG